MHKEIEVVLKTPLKYTKNGEKAEEQIMVLRAPTLQASQITRKHARKLKALVGSALIGMRAMSRANELTADEKAASPEQEKAVTDATMVDAMWLAGIDVSDMCDVMGQLAPSVVTIGDQGSFKETHWAALDMGDQEKILGKYLENFILA